MAAASRPGSFTAALCAPAAPCRAGATTGSVSSATVLTRRGSPPVTVAGISNAVAVAPESNTRAPCWPMAASVLGRQQLRQLGDNSTERLRLTPVTSAPHQRDRDHAGEYYSCACWPSGTVRCWGGQHSGQLGDNSTERLRLTPSPSAASPARIAITAGEYYSCGCWPWHARCWGLNINGPLGDGTRTTRRAPVPVVGSPTRCDRRRRKQGHTCALLADGSVRCWASMARGARRGQRHHDRLTQWPSRVSSTPWPSRRATPYVRGARDGVSAAGAATSWAARRRHRHGSADPIRITVFNAVAITGGNGHTCALAGGGGAHAGARTLGRPSGRDDDAPTLPETVTAQFRQIVTSFSGATVSPPAIAHVRDPSQ